MPWDALPFLFTKGAHKSKAYTELANDGSIAHAWRLKLCRDAAVSNAAACSGLLWAPTTVLLCFPINTHSGRVPVQFPVQNSSESRKADDGPVFCTTWNWVKTLKASR